MEIVRGRLVEIVPANERYDTSTGDAIYQVTTDGGVTWVDMPQADPRYTPSNLLPPLAEDDSVPCDVSARMTAQLEDTLNLFLSTIDQFQFASEIFAILGALEGAAGILLSLAIFAGEQLIDIGQANIASAFTSAVYDDIRCAFHCRVSADGRITQGALEDAYAEIEALHSGTVADTINVLRLLYGDVAMTNAGVTREETGDCSDCDPCTWRWEWVGNALRDEWTPASRRPCSGTSYLAATAYYDPSLSTGSWHAPVGSGAGRSVLWLSANFTIPVGSTITKLGAHVTQGGVHVDSNGIGVANSHQPLTCSSTVDQNVAPTTFPNWLITLSPTYTGDVFCRVICDENATNGQSWCDRIYVEGTGKCPFGDASNY